MMPWYIHTIRSIYSDNCWSGTNKKGIYARAVAEPYTAGRLQAAWSVLTGRAVAFQWPKVGDIEDALKLPFWDHTYKPNGGPSQAQQEENAADFRGELPPNLG